MVVRTAGEVQRYGGSIRYRTFSEDWPFQQHAGACWSMLEHAGEHAGEHAEECSVPSTWYQVLGTKY